GTTAPAGDALARLPVARAVCGALHGHLFEGRDASLGRLAVHVAEALSAEELGLLEEFLGSFPGREIAGALRNALEGEKAVLFFLTSSARMGGPSAYAFHCGVPALRTPKDKP
ncbi:MAG TPA: hypothetical protein VFH51_03090, partial [Myxococcota bacterium]|nr:hypothetical protein [Myxococcota bacterium]